MDGQDRPESDACRDNVQTELRTTQKSEVFTEVKLCTEVIWVARIVLKMKVTYFF